MTHRDKNDIATRMVPSIVIEESRQKKPDMANQIAQVGDRRPFCLGHYDDGILPEKSTYCLSAHVAYERGRKRCAPI